MTAKKVLHTLISRLLLICASIIFLVPILLFICLPAKWRYDNRPLFWITHAFYWVMLKCTLLPVRYFGAEKIPAQPAIFVANHQSSLDIPLMGLLANKSPHIWLAKHELMEGLFLRWVLPLFAVLVDASSPKKAMRSLLKLISLLNGKKRHLMIFPEGGRYTDGTIHEFFNGFVILAKKLGRPVVPVYIEGVNKAYPPDSFFVNWQPIRVVVGDPFVYQQDDTDDQFKNRVYQWFVQQTMIKKEK